MDRLRISIKATRTKAKLREYNYRIRRRATTQTPQDTRCWMQTIHRSLYISVRHSLIHTQEFSVATRKPFGRVVNSVFGGVAGGASLAGSTNPGKASVMGIPVPVGPPNKDDSQPPED